MSGGSVLGGVGGMAGVCGTGSGDKVNGSSYICTGGRVNNGSFVGCGSSMGGYCSMGCGGTIGVVAVCVVIQVSVLAVL